MLAFLLEILTGQQGFEDARAGGLRPKPGGLLEFGAGFRVRHELVDVAHGIDQAAVGEVCRWLGLPGLYLATLSLDGVSRLHHRDRRTGLVGRPVGFLFVVSGMPSVELFPAQIEILPSGGFPGFSVDLHEGGKGLVTVVRQEEGHIGFPDQLKNLGLDLGKPTGPLAGGDDGVVSRDLGVVPGGMLLPGIHQSAQAFGDGEASQDLRGIGQLLLGQVAAVGSGITGDLLLVEGLAGVQDLLCGEPVATGGDLLQSRQAEGQRG